MLTKKQKRQIRLLCRQHNKMEDAKMKVHSYHAYHGMDAFVGDEWYSAAKRNDIFYLFSEKLSRLCDQHSETCWSDTPIGPFGLMGEVDGLRSPVDLWSRPIVNCDTRVNGMRTVRPSRLNLAIEIIKGKEKATFFDHSEILVQKAQNIKFWIRQEADACRNALYYIDSAIESGDAEEVIKAYTYRYLLFKMEGVADMNVLNDIITQAQYNSLEIITIDYKGTIVDPVSIEDIESVEEYLLSDEYYPEDIEIAKEETKANLFQRFLEDGSNAKLASICCPAWVTREAEAVYEELEDYKADLCDITYARKIMKEFSEKINTIITHMKEYMEGSIYSNYYLSTVIELFYEINDEIGGDEPPF